MSAAPAILDTLWLPALDGDARARWLFQRHYPRRRYRDGRKPKLFVGPGEKAVLLTVNCDALFIWRKFKDKSGETGVNCAAFRNESALLSSDLIREACAIAWQKWPGERLYTYVNPRRIRSTNPGCCFIKAGWQRLPYRTKEKQLVILERWP